MFVGVISKLNISISPALFTTNSLYRILQVWAELLMQIIILDNIQMSQLINLKIYNKPQEQQTNINVTFAIFLQLSLINALLFFYAYARM